MLDQYGLFTFRLKWSKMRIKKNTEISRGGYEYEEKNGRNNGWIDL